VLRQEHEPTKPDLVCMDAFRFASIYLCCCGNVWVGSQACMCMLHYCGTRQQHIAMSIACSAVSQP